MQRHDPIFAQIENNGALNRKFSAFTDLGDEDEPVFAKALDDLHASNMALLSTVPNSREGLVAFINYLKTSRLSESYPYCISAIETLSRSVKQLIAPDCTR